MPVESGAKAARGQRAAGAAPAFPKRKAPLFSGSGAWLTALIEGGEAH